MTTRGCTACIHLLYNLIQSGLLFSCQTCTVTNKCSYFQLGCMLSASQCSCSFQRMALAKSCAELFRHQFSFEVFSLKTFVHFFWHFDWELHLPVAVIHTHYAPLVELIKLPILKKVINTLNHQYTQLNLSYYWASYWIYWSRNSHHYSTRIGILCVSLVPSFVWSHGDMQQSPFRFCFSQFAQGGDGEKIKSRMDEFCKIPQS